MVYARIEADGTVKSSVDKFYTQEVLQQLKEAFGAKPGDLILILSGDDAMTLIVHTGREMYGMEGIHHQSNITFVINS